MKILVFIDISIIEFFRLKKFEEEEKKNLFYFSHGIQTDFFFLSETKKNILIKEKIQEKEEIQQKEKDERCLPQKNWTKEKTLNFRKLKNKEKPQHSQTIEAQNPVQLSCKTLRGTPLKATLQEAQREE